MSDKTVLYRLEKVAKDYRGAHGRRRVVDDVSAEIRQGEFLALRGESGAGKSTILNMLAGITAPSAGTVLFAGRNIYRWFGLFTPHFRNTNTGFIFQDFQLLPGLTVEQNVQLPLLFSLRLRFPEKKAIPSILERLGLGDKSRQFPHQLSGGEAQRVAIARALVMRPRVLFADEPTGNLDAKTEKLILEALLAEKKQHGFTLIAASHSESFIRQADSVWIVDQGRVITNEPSQVPAPAPAKKQRRNKTDNPDNATRQEPEPTKPRARRRRAQD